MCFAAFCEFGVLPILVGFAYLVVLGVLSLFLGGCQFDSFFCLVGLVLCAV